MFLVNVCKKAQRTNFDIIQSLFVRKYSLHCVFLLTSISTVQYSIDTTQQVGRCCTVRSLMRCCICNPIKTISSGGFTCFYPTIHTKSICILWVTG